MRFISVLAVFLLSLPQYSSAEESLEQYIIDRIFDALVLKQDIWFHEGNYMRSAQALKMQVEAYPHEMDAYFTAAWLLWSCGYDSEAQGYFLRAVRYNPADYRPYMEAGLHWMGRRDYRRASLWLSQACLQLDAPAQAYKSLSHSYKNLGLTLDAFRVMQLAGTIDPQDEMIELNLKWLSEEKDSGKVKEY